MPSPSCSIQIGQQAPAGQPVILQWTSQNAQYAQLSNTGQIQPQGQMQVYPTGPTTYIMTVTGYGNQQAQCQAQYGQGGTGAPVAELSCEPERVDIGMQIGISFACQNATSATATGFSTNNQLSGSVTVTAPPLPGGQYAKTYGLTCANAQGQTNTAQCAVTINKTALVLVANPKQVESGKESTLGWVTSGMNSCTISSPTNTAFTTAHEDNTSTSGSAKTGNLTTNTEFVLTCETEGGVTKTATTTVTVAN